MQSYIDSPKPDLRWGNLLRERVFSVFLWQQHPQHPRLLHVQKPTAVFLQISWMWAVNLMYWTASAGRLHLPWAACPPRPCSTGKGESFPCVVCTYPGSLRPTVCAVLQHSHNGSAIDRGMAKLCHFLWAHALNGAVTGRDHILRWRREQRDISKAGKTQPKLQMKIPLFFCCCKMEWIWN